MGTLHFDNTVRSQRDGARVLLGTLVVVIPSDSPRSQVAINGDAKLTILANKRAASVLDGEGRTQLIPTQNVGETATLYTPPCLEGLSSNSSLGLKPLRVGVPVVMSGMVGTDT